MFARINGYNSNSIIRESQGLLVYNLEMKKNIVLAGRKPVQEAILEGKTIDKIIVDIQLRGEDEIAIRKAAKEKDIPLYKWDRSRIDKLTSANHQGVIAYLSPIAYQNIEDLIPLWFETGLTPTVLVLDGVTDVRNFGAIARSAEVLGANAILIPARGTAAINDMALKISAGALLRIPVCRERSIANSLKHLKDSGFSVVATVFDLAKPIGEVNLNGPIALIMGSEDEGISPHLLRLADKRVYIPQPGDGDSLNVSVATGILLYEISRQRKLEHE